MMHRIAHCNPMLLSHANKNEVPQIFFPILRLTAFPSWLGFRNKANAHSAKMSCLHIVFLLLFGVAAMLTSTLHVPWSPCKGATIIKFCSRVYEDILYQLPAANMYKFHVNSTDQGNPSAKPPELSLRD